MSETKEGSTYKLDEVINWDKVEYEKVSPDYYKFVAPDLVTARKIGFQVAKKIAPVLVDSNEKIFKEQELLHGINGVRIDGMDTSYDESTIKGGPDSGKVQVMLFLRNFAGDKTFIDLLAKAIEAVVPPSLREK